MQLQELEAVLAKNREEKDGVVCELKASKKLGDELEVELNREKEDHRNLKDINVQLVEQIQRMKGIHVCRDEQNFRA